MTINIDLELFYISIGNVVAIRAEYVYFHGYFVLVKDS